MTDPNTPAPDGQPTPPAPRYGEYAQTPPAPAEQAAAPAYSAPAYAAPAYNAAPAYSGVPASGTSYPGKTLGIIAFVLAIVPVGLSLVGLILGIIALVQSKKAGRSNGFAIAAIVIGALAVIVGILLVFAIVIPSLNAATTCLNDPTGTTTMWGVNLPCEEVLKQSGR